MDFTKIVRPLFMKRVKIAERYADYGDIMQRQQLQSLLATATSTEFGTKYDFASIDSYESFSQRVPIHNYDDLQPSIMRMLAGEPDILWRGVIKNFAQSSGTAGKSKYIPISKESFSKCHYQGGFDTVAHYFNINPASRMFSGKGFILGGSFATEILAPCGVCVGDLSANLINNINPLVNLVRVPSKEVALMPDWEKKLPALVNASRSQNVTNISGVPSWFLTVIKEILKSEHKDCINDVWKNLEVFFHGGISFTPYREQYSHICDNSKMHYIETYNASEGFFAVQSSLDTNAMLLLLDLGVFFEFVPLDEIDNTNPHAIPLWEVERGKTYALIITANNGLWRYSIGDTVRIEQTNPVKIRIIGRTKHFINAFGEELMVHNADEAIARVSSKCGVEVLNYTAAPVYASDNARGHHQWLIEFVDTPHNISNFATMLDEELQNVNSDYEAKRYKGIFLDSLSIVEARKGLFDDWLSSTGKLGGQRKIPRLANSRELIEQMHKFNNDN
ncbi:MAG: GH3 auxin-responsive promoter family protein [Muribaculaceae bacterium]